MLSALGACAFSPELKYVQPRGGKIGSEIEVRFLGNRLFEPEEVLLYKGGISVSSLEKGEDDKSVKATFVIAPDAPLGEHPVRLRCKNGITYMRTFWVGQFPTVMEARSEDDRVDLNNEFDSPQEINLHTTVQGWADREDADYYRVQAKKGEHVCRATYYDPLKGARGWYYETTDKIVVRMRYVLATDVALLDPSEEVKLPRYMKKVDRDFAEGKIIKKMDSDMDDYLIDEAKRRECHDFDEYAEDFDVESGDEDGEGEGEEDAMSINESGNEDSADEDNEE